MLTTLFGNSNNRRKQQFEIISRLMQLDEIIKEEEQQLSTAGGTRTSYCYSLWCAERERLEIEIELLCKRSPERSPISLVDAPMSPNSLTNADPAYDVTFFSNKYDINSDDNQGSISDLSSLTVSPRVGSATR